MHRLALNYGGMHPHLFYLRNVSYCCFLRQPLLSCRSFEKDETARYFQHRLGVCHCRLAAYWISEWCGSRIRTSGPFVYSTGNDQFSLGSCHSGSLSTQPTLHPGTADYIVVIPTPNDEGFVALFLVDPIDCKSMETSRVGQLGMDYCRLW